MSVVRINAREGCVGGNLVLSQMNDWRAQTVVILE